MTCKMEDFFHPDLVFFGLDAADRTEAIKQLGAQLYSRGYVTEDYTDQVLRREVSFPTGLIMENGETVALPHTDTQYCLRPGIAIGVFKSPVEFFEMATDDHVIRTNILFQLSIVEPSHQVVWLARLTNVFQHPGFLTRMQESSCAEEVFSFVCEELRKEESLEELG